MNNSDCQAGVCSATYNGDQSNYNAARALAFASYGVAIVGVAVGILGLTVLAPKSEGAPSAQLAFNGNGFTLSGQF